MKIKALLTSLFLIGGVVVSSAQEYDSDFRIQNAGYHKAIPRREIRHLIVQDGSLNTASNPLSRASGDYVLESAKKFPTIGEIKAVVILAQFKDIKFSVSGDSIRALLSKRYNADNYTEEVAFEEYSNVYGQRLSLQCTIPGSARDYFRDQSFGQFVPSFEVIGPVTLSQNRSYYGANNNSGNDKNVPSMIREACQKAYESGTDFTNYDNDGDNVADIVYVVYAGCDEAQTGLTDAVWAQAYELSTPLTLGDAKVSRYACSGELLVDLPIVAGIGTFVHEFSHILGLPDFYNTGLKSNEEDFTMDIWSVMDYGNYNAEGFIPCAYTAFERYSLGWIPMHTLDAPVTMSIGTTNEEHKGYRVFTTEVDTTSFYILETIHQEGWNSWAAANGLLISKVEYDSRAWKNNEVNKHTLNSSQSQPHDKHRHFVIPANNDYYWGTADLHLFGNEVYEFRINDYKYLTDIDTKTGKTSFKFHCISTSTKMDEFKEQNSGISIYYDLLGRPVENPSRGIYIHNGKKVVIK